MIEKNLESFNVNTLNFVSHQDNNLCISNIDSISSNSNLDTILSMNTNKSETATAASQDIKSNTKTNNQQM
jgi:hypothetical protein